jgi:hypothetical protein
MKIDVLGNNLAFILKIAKDGKINCTSYIWQFSLINNKDDINKKDDIIILLQMSECLSCSIKKYR